MFNDPHRVLWCLMKHDSNPFEVTAPVDASIGRLKKLIWEERKNGVLRGIDATDLVLRKVSSKG
jgi:Crinkler effector protein N-terminal domain